MFLSQNGYNGMKRVLVPDEVMSKVVSGKIYVIKAVVDGDTNLCLKIYDHFGFLTLSTVYFCNSIMDALEDEKRSNIGFVSK